MHSEYGKVIWALRSQYRIEYGAIVEDQDYRYELILTAFDKDHLQKLWEEIYTIELDVLLAHRKVEELKIKSKEDSDVIFSLFPTDEASLALKDQLIKLRIKYYDKVYATQLLNL